MSKMNVGIIGCGAIGTQLARTINSDLASRVNLVSLYDVDCAKAERLAQEFRSRIIVEKSSQHLIKRVKLVIESASAQVSAQIACECLKFGRDVLIMSVGGLQEKAGEILSLAGQSSSRVFIPSGAVCGIDGLKALKCSRITGVKLTTRKPAAALANNKYLEDKGIDPGKITSDTVVFEGSAAEAVAFFPQNVNVAAVLSLAGIGFNETRVSIVVSPGSSVNTHEIEIDSEAAKLFIRAENKPHPDNPKTSSLAVLSAIATLRGILDNVRIGS